MIFYTYSRPHCVKCRHLIKKILIMKLIVFILFIACMQVNAAGYAQKITISEKNTTLEKTLAEIKRQSGYQFWYEGVVIKKAGRLDVNLYNASIEAALDECFKNQPFSYKIFGKSIVIKEKEAIFKRVIKGIVTDSVGAVPGVSVKVKGRPGVGSSTDMYGRYTLEVPDDKAILVFSMVGYVTQEVPVSGKETINIRLVPSSEALGEVVVVAFGTQKKESITGAIASIQTKELKQSPAANLAVTLAGRLPGLNVIQRSGEPGRDVTQLFIRGQGTVNSQSPIILVDGIEREITYIDPNEVESVTILKDASSTALFGVRGANGVILVTTRRGVSEIPEISLTTEVSAQDFTRFPSPVNSSDYALLRNLALTNDGLPYKYSAEAIEKYRSGSDPLRYPNTNWKDILMKDYSFQKRYNLNVSGATKTKMKYFVNAGYLNQGGQFKTEKNHSYDPSFFLDRYNFRSNIDLTLNKNLKAFLNIGGYVEKANSPAGANTGGLSPGEIDSQSSSLYVLAYMNDLNATTPGPTTPTGEVTTVSGIEHPSYGQLNRTGYVQRSQSNIMATYGMEQSLDMIVKGLSIKAVASFDTKAINNLFAYKTYPKMVQVIDPNLKGQDGQDSVYFRPLDNNKDVPLGLYSARLYTTKSNVQGYLNYNRVFDKHAVSGLVLYQQEQTIVNGDLPYNLQGFSTRFTYSYDNRYFAEFNAGYNGSEQFAKGRRFGFFPAFSAAWNITEEKFLKDNQVINQLKLRGSYGKVGNDRIGGRRFLYLDNIQVGGGGASSSLGNGQSITINSLKNDHLQWEVAKKLNIGFELGLFDAFNLVVDVFSEKRDNILRYRGTIPALNGFSTSVLSPVNIGVIENKGYEIELNYKKHFSNDFSILSKVNFNYARNKQIFADEALLNEDYAYRYRETGYSIGQSFGYLVDGYFKDAADVLNSPVQSVGGHVSRPGDFKYKDLNGDGLVNDKDLAPIGHPTVPEYTFGGALNVNFKNFDISVLLQGVTNVYNFYRSRNTFPIRNFYTPQLQSWTPERAASGEPITWPRLTTEVSPNEIANSFFIINASYIRLKNVELGYTFPSKWANKIGAGRIRLYANGLNLITWDKLPNKDIDPEISGGMFEGYSYPITRLYNLGLNVTF